MQHGGGPLPIPATFNVEDLFGFVIGDTTFAVETGLGTVELFFANTAGRLPQRAWTFTSWTGVAWPRKQRGRGAALANGIYLYRVTVEGAQGETLQSAVHKLVVLRWH